MSAAAIPTCGGGHVPRARTRPRGLGGHPLRLVIVIRCEADIARALTRTRPFTVIFEAPVIPLAVEPDPPGIVARRPRRGELGGVQR